MWIDPDEVDLSFATSSEKGKVTLISVKCRSVLRASDEVAVLLTLTFR